MGAPSGVDDGKVADVVTVGLGTPRAQRTVQTLRARIASGEWPLNSKIPTEAALAAELQVGRSTIREAVRSLASLGMLEPAVGRGTFVRALTPVSMVLSEFLEAHDVREVLAFRRALEVEAAQLAAQLRSADELERIRTAHERDLAGACVPSVERGVAPGQFHALVLAASGNRLLADLHSGAMAALRGAIRSGRVLHGIDTDERQQDHSQILEAIRAGDAARAAQAAAAHADRDLVLPEGRPSDSIDGP